MTKGLDKKSTTNILQQLAASHTIGQDGMETIQGVRTMKDIQKLQTDPTLLKLFDTQIDYSDFAQKGGKADRFKEGLAGADDRTLQAQQTLSTQKLASNLQAVTDRTALRVIVVKDNK